MPYRQVNDGRAIDVARGKFVGCPDVEVCVARSNERAGLIAVDAAGRDGERVRHFQPAIRLREQCANYRYRRGLHESLREFSNFGISRSC